MVDFAGWDMPVQYSGVIEEHQTVRNACGLFDVSHMGEIEISGPGAHAFVQRLTTNDIDKAVDGQCQYTLICYPDGGVVDDCIVYRYNPERFLFVVNASNADKVYAWMQAQAGQGPQAGQAGGEEVLIENLSANYAQLALQGPKAEEVLDVLMDVDPAEVPHFHFVMAELMGEVEAIVSRTGYTGEDGFEIYFDPADAVKLWNALMEAGQDSGIKPIGLGARDTLRLEMGYSLYGHELSEKITPIEAGLKKYVKFTKDFIGREVLEKQAASGAPRKLIAFKMIDPGVPRADYEIASKGKKIGQVSSGTSSPSLGAGIGLGFVESGFDGKEVDIMIRNRAAKAAVTSLPFHKKA